MGEAESEGPRSNVGFSIPLPSGRRQKWCHISVTFHLPGATPHFLKVDADCGIQIDLQNLCRRNRSIRIVGLCRWREIWFCPTVHSRLLHHRHQNIMENLLSLLIPVHNAQSNLSADIDELLTIAMELTPWPDLIVIDNGSTDATIEIACEIAIGYPQVRCLRQQQKCSLRRIVETGLKRARGQYVFVRTGAGRLEATEMRKLWQSCSQFEKNRWSRQGLRTQQIGPYVTWTAATQVPGFQVLDCDRTTGELLKVETREWRVQEVESGELSVESPGLRVVSRRKKRRAHVESR